MSLRPKLIAILWAFFTLGLQGGFVRIGREIIPFLGQYLDLLRHPRTNDHLQYLLSRHSFLAVEPFNFQRLMVLH